MWILTVSIIKPKMTGQHSENTFSLKMEKKGDDHRVIEDEFDSDLEKFNNNNSRWFLPKNSTHKKSEIIYICMPWRQSGKIYNITYYKGNGIYASRWEHLIDIKSVHDVVPSCKDCRKLNILLCGEVQSGESYSCRRCVNLQ